MTKRILPWALLSAFAAAAALLVADKRSPSRESLLPVLRVVQQHEKQADRALSRVLPLSREEERRIGAEIDSRLNAAAAGPAAQAEENLVSEMGRTLASRPELKRFGGQYRFRVLHDAQAVNAFAVPGGFIYLTGGLVRRCRANPALLLFVIGHEMGHIELGHCADAYRTREWFRKVGLSALGTAAAFFRTLAELQFSEVQELEADAFAVRLIHSAGQDPSVSLQAMDILGLTQDSDKETKRDPGKVAAEGLTDYFRTHPGSWERRSRLQSEIERLPQRRPAGR
jgi:predicted Zn-dependent protease